jgi:hypothetical protein
MPTLTDLNLRWKHEGPVVNPVSWQLTYVNPPVPLSPVAKTEQIGIAPSSGGYSTYTIPASMIPSGAPSTFHVRVRYLNGSSNWVRVFVGQRASSPTADPHSVLGAASEQRRQDNTNQGSGLSGLKPVTIPPAPAGPFTTSGVKNINNTKLWMNLVGIVCDHTSDDGSPNDEIYAITYAVNLNRSNMAESDVYWRLTKVYEGFSNGETRSVNYPVWASEDSPHEILDNNNFFVIARVIEYDGDRPRETAAKIAYGLLRATLAKMPASMSRAQIVDSLQAVTGRAIGNFVGDYNNIAPSPVNPSVSLVDGDDFIDPQTFVMSDIEIDGARQGKIVKKNVTFAYGAAKYRLRFEMGKEGSSTVAW